MVATLSHVYDEALTIFPVIMLLIFMVAGIFFLKELLLFTFTKIIIGVRSKAMLFFSVYHKAASGKQFNQDDHDHADSDPGFAIHCAIR